MVNGLHLWPPKRFTLPHIHPFTHTFIVSAMQGGIVYYKMYISLYTKMYIIYYNILYKVA